MRPKAPKHGRMKPKRKPMNAAERRHAAEVCSGGCLVCGKPGEYHHEYSVARGEIKTHKHGVCLCLKHHQRPFKYSRHQMGRDAFNAHHGVDIAAEAGWPTTKGKEPA